MVYFPLPLNVVQLYLNDVDAFMSWLGARTGTSFQLGGVFISGAARQMHYAAAAAEGYISQSKLYYIICNAFASMQCMVICKL